MEKVHMYKQLNIRRGSPLIVWTVVLLLEKSYSVAFSRVVWGRGVRIVLLSGFLLLLLLARTIIDHFTQFVSRLVFSQDSQSLCEMLHRGKYRKDYSLLYYRIFFSSVILIMIFISPRVEALFLDVGELGVGTPAMALATILWVAPRAVFALLYRVCMRT